MIDNAFFNPSEADIVFIGAPYYGTCGERGNGPLLVRRALNKLSSYSIKCGVDAFDCLKISDAGDLPVKSFKQLSVSAEKLLSGINGLPLIIGGEHTVSLPFIKALRPKSVLLFDAHADLFDSYNGRRVSYATVSRRISELVDEVFIVGVRDLTISEAEFLDGGGNVSLIDFSDVERFSGKDLYVSVDLDVLDPVYCPSVSTPVPGGVSYSFLVKVLNKVLLNNNLVGLDFTELTARRDCLSSVNVGGLVMNYLKRRCC